MGRSDFEKCTECGYQIPRSEQAYVFKGSIVCAECDKMLRNESNTGKEIQDYLDEDILDIPVQPEYEEQRLNQEVFYPRQDSKDDPNSYHEEFDPDSDKIFTADNTAGAENGIQAKTGKEVSVLESTGVYDFLPEQGGGGTELPGYVTNRAGENEAGQLVLKLPSFLHSYYLNGRPSSNHSSISGGRNVSNSFVILMCCGAAVAIIAVLLKIYLF